MDLTFLLAEWLSTPAWMWLAFIAIYALSVVLIFIGSKIFVADLIGLDKFPPALSLAITFGILAAGVVSSLWKTRGNGQGAKELGAAG